MKIIGIAVLAVIGMYIGSVLGLRMAFEMIDPLAKAENVQYGAIRDLENTQTHGFQGSLYQLQEADWTQPEDEFNSLYTNNYQLQ